MSGQMPELNEAYKKMMQERFKLLAKLDEVNESIRAMNESLIMNGEKQEVKPVATPETVKEYEPVEIAQGKLPDKDLMSDEKELQYLLETIGVERAMQIENAISLEMHRGNSARYKVRNTNENEMVINHSDILSFVRNSAEEEYAMAYARSQGVNVVGFLELEDEENFISIANASLYNKADATSLSYEETTDLFRQLNELPNDDKFEEQRESIKEQLVRGNMRLALMLAHRFSFIPFDSIQDRQQVAMMGLTRAINGYDYTLGNKFSSYAWKVIKGTLMNESQKENSKGFGLPQYVKEYFRRIEQYEETFIRQQHRKPEEWELAEVFGISVERVRELQKIKKELEIQSFDKAYEKIEEREDVFVDELPEPVEPEFMEELTVDERMTEIADMEAYGLDDSTPAENTAKRLMREQLMGALNTLTPREKKVLVLRFGLEDGRQRTLEEVGREFNVLRERVRQIEAKALRKLRHPSKSKKLEGYIR